MRGIRIAVKYLICKNIVLILVRRPVIKVVFSPESSIITAEVICTVEVSRISLLRERVVPVHLEEHFQIIILIVDRRIAQFFVIIPADDVTARRRCIIVSDPVVSYLDREEIESVPFIPQLLEHIISDPRISLEQIRAILLQIRIGVQRHAVLQDRGEILICGDNIRQVTAGQSGRELIRCHIVIPDLHSRQVRQILPQAQILIIAWPGTRSAVSDRQDYTLLRRVRFPGSGRSLCGGRSS